MLADSCLVSKLISLLILKVVEILQKFLFIQSSNKILELYLFDLKQNIRNISIWKTPNDQWSNSLRFILFLSRTVRLVPVQEANENICLIK